MARCTGRPVRAVPQQRGLALIGDADGDDVFGAGAGFAHGGAAGFERRRPQVLGLVLDLAVGREMLGKLLLGERRDRGVGAEQDGPRRGRALVDREDVGRHRLPLGQPSRAALIAAEKVDTPTATGKRGQLSTIKVTIS